MSTYYTPSGNPVSLSRGASGLIRAEFALIDAGFAKLPLAAALNAGYANYLVDTGAVNAMVVQPASVVTTLADGMTFLVKVKVSNTGASTLTLTGVTGGAAVPVVRPDGTATATGDMTAGQIVQLSYDLTNTRFQLSTASAAAVSSAAASAAAALASANAAAASATSAQNYAAALNGTSASAVAIATGSKSFTASTGKQWAVGSYLVLASAATPANFMYGQVTAYNSGTGALTVNVTTTGGSGSPSDWVISLSTAVPSYASLSDIITQNPIKGTTGGSSTAYTFTPATAIVAYAVGQRWNVTFNADSGDQPTFQVSGVGSPPNLVKLLPNGTFANIRAGDIKSGMVSDVIMVASNQALVCALPVAPSSGHFNPKTFPAGNVNLTYSDAGSFYTHNEAAAGRTLQIPDNASTPIPLGFTQSGFNMPGASAITVAITSDTLIQVGTGSTGSRTVAANGNWTLVKVLATTWIIAGAGIT